MTPHYTEPHQCPMCGGPVTMIRNDNGVWDYVATEERCRHEWIPGVNPATWFERNDTEECRRCGKVRDR